MIQAKVPSNLPQWMLDHVDQYLKSGGKDGHQVTAWSHNFCRSAPVTVRALAFTVLVPTCTSTSGLARMFLYQPGWSGAPPLDATRK